MHREPIRMEAVWNRPLVARGLVLAVAATAPDRSSSTAVRPSAGRVEAGAQRGGLHWACRVGLVTDAEAERVSSAWAAEPTSAVQAWHSAVDIRESLYAVLAAALGPAEPADGAVAEMERLVLRWSAATARSSLRLGGPGEPPAVFTAGGRTLLVPDRLAYAAIDLATTANLSQLRACPVAEGGCGWLFLDRGRNRSRRWCAMEDCGTQAKSRRLTTRRRTNRA